ncbi:MAG: glycosyltransferase family 2 protein [Verrucomicrobia bacterium]|nr:glycosyltransferase family 2 protein [Verrucomicrobiota bacterium]
MNELDGMRAIMPRIKPEWVDQILVADGQSTDGTQEYAREHGYDLVVQSKKGGRHAFVEGFRKVKGDIVITFSPNGKSVPELIPQLIEKMNEGYDMVIASRYLPLSKSADDHFVSAFANWFFTTAINLLFGGRYTDAMVLYRAYRTRLFYELELDQAEHHAPEKLFGIVIGIEPLLSIRAAKRKLGVTEIPGDEPARIGGVNKFPKISGGLAYLFQMIRELWHWK